MNPVLSVPPPRSLDKRLVLAGLLLAALAIAFWTGSRYPALNDKAAMGAETPTTGIAFNEVVAMPEDASVWTEMGVNAINWAYTNKQGMTFGLLFAAVVLMVLPLLTRIQYRSRWANTALGVAMGTPLGVCVNCATPIAQGIHAAGARAETTLATLFSSPTMNVVVLTMTLALFPAYVAGIKIGLTLAFILIGLPLLLGWLPSPGLSASDQATVLDEGLTSDALLPDEPAMPQEPPPTTWLGAVVWLVTSFVKSLWYIVRTTLPLMLLAGVLGAVAITLLPWEHIVDMLPVGGPVTTLIAMSGLAIVGTFLPVPIAFDVILCAVLWGAGVPRGYVVVLLVTLGVFSVYPFMVLWREMSRAIAIALFLAVAGLGVASGALAHVVGNWDDARQQHLLFSELLPEASDRKPSSFPTVAVAADSLMPQLETEAWAAPLPISADAPAGVTVARRAFQPTGRPGSGFTKIDGAQLGLEESVSFSVYRMLLGIAENRGIASGDVHNDGWPDLVTTSEAGVALYANLHGERFVRQQVEVPLFDSLYVTRAALVDVTGDGWLDLYVSAFNGGTYLVVNQGGRFEDSGLVRLPNREGVIHAASAAFGDIDRDGDLDVLLGNEAGSNQGVHQGLVVGRNVLLINDPDGFTPRALPGLDGETLTLLLSDLDRDGDLDLYAGNDFGPADVLAFGDGQGGFDEVHRSDEVLPYSGYTTMSLSAADIDNDLVPEIYLAQVAREDHHFVPIPEYCEAYDRPQDQSTCAEAMTAQRITHDTFRRGDLRGCLTLSAGYWRGTCALRTAYSMAAYGPEVYSGLCDSLGERWPGLGRHCLQQKSGAIDPVSPEVSQEVLKTHPKANLFFRRGEDGRYTDLASAMGIADGGWSWNAAFADVDNDTWQDLFLVNGFLFNKATDRNRLFHNDQGAGFSDVSESSGLGTITDASASTFVDYDRDGDLDVIVPTALGPILVYRNDVNDGQSIRVSLRDGKGNPFGIGSQIIVHYGPNGDLHQFREVRASGGFASYDEPAVHFGLGDHDAVDRIEVVWSTGERSEIRGNFRAGAEYVISRE